MTCRVVVDRDFYIRSGPGGPNLKFETLEELVSVAAAPYTDTLFQIDAETVVLAVTTKIKVQPGGTTDMAVGDVDLANRYSGGSSTAVGTTTKGTRAPNQFYFSQQPIRLTFDSTPSDTAGRVLVTAFTYRVIPATS
jgi:hypothetical protein